MQFRRYRMNRERCGNVASRAGPDAGIRRAGCRAVAARPAQPLRLRRLRAGAAMTLIADSPGAGPGADAQRVRLLPAAVLPGVGRSALGSRRRHGRRRPAAPARRRRRRSRPAPGRRRAEGGAVGRAGQRAAGHHGEARPGRGGRRRRRPGRHEEGAARAGRRRRWEADAVQVCAQVLLLREHGYTVERGEIFYAETRQRVPVEITPELVARTMEIVAEARDAGDPARRPRRRCSRARSAPRCSLVGICLPDETNVLAGRGRTASRGG